MDTNSHQPCRLESRCRTLPPLPFEARRELIAFLTGYENPGRGWTVWMAELMQTSLLGGFWNAYAFEVRKNTSCGAILRVHGPRHPVFPAVTGLRTAPTVSPRTAEAWEASSWSHLVCKSSYHPLNPPPYRCAVSTEGVWSHWRLLSSKRLCSSLFETKVRIFVWKRILRLWL